MATTKLSIIPENQSSSYIYVICVCLLIEVPNIYWLYEWHGGYLLESWDCLSFMDAWVHPRFFMLWFSLVFVMCLVLPVSLDCPFLIAPSGFSDWLVLPVQQIVNGIFNLISWIFISLNFVQGCSNVLHTFRLLINGQR